MTKKEAVKSGDFQVTYAMSANSKDMLITGSQQRNQTPRGSQSFSILRCRTFPHMTTTCTITNGKDTYKIRGKFSCQFHDVVNAFTCSICNSQYIGDTENTLSIRCRGHISNMNTHNLNHLTKHYKRYNHTSEDYIVCATDKESDKNKRLRLEEVWIILLDTLYNKGLSFRW